MENSVFKIGQTVLVTDRRRHNSRHIWYKHKNCVNNNEEYIIQDIDYTYFDGIVLKINNTAYRGEYAKIISQPLPKKWFINVTKDNQFDIEKWLGEHSFNLGDWSCVSYNKTANDRGNQHQDLIEINTKQFRNEILNKKQEVMKIQTIKRGDLLKLYKQFTCSDFQNRVEPYLKDTWNKDTNYEIEIKQVDLDYLIGNGTDSQQGMAVEALIDLIEDKNIFKKNLSSLTVEIFSKEITGESGIFQLSNAAAEYMGRKDLINRSLYVKSDIRVIIHENIGSNEDTVLEFIRK